MWRWIGTSSGAERSWPNPKLWSNRNQPSMLVNHDEPMNAWIIFFAQNTFTCVTLRFADTTTGNWDMDGYGLKVSQSPNKQMHGLIMFKHLKWTRNFFGYWITPKHKIHTVYIYIDRWTTSFAEHQSNFRINNGNRNPKDPNGQFIGHHLSWDGEDGDLTSSDFFGGKWRSKTGPFLVKFREVTEKNHEKITRKSHYSPEFLSFQDICQ